jgi:hypothetical protein
MNVRLGNGPRHLFEPAEDEPTKAERADLREARRQIERLSYRVSALERTAKVAASLLTRSTSGEGEPVKRARGRPKGS